MLKSFHDRPFSFESTLREVTKTREEEQVKGSQRDNEKMKKNQRTCNFNEVTDRVRVQVRFCSHFSFSHYTSRARSPFPIFPFPVLVSVIPRFSNIRV